MEANHYLSKRGPNAEVNEGLTLVDKQQKLNTEGKPQIIQTSGDFG